jgi:predicted RNA binding protein YcfA (HicA-like mRNA interferase family)
VGQHKSQGGVACAAPQGVEGRFAKGSHVKLNHPQYGNYMFGFHDREEIGSVMLAKIGKKTGLTPDDI